ncbi:N/A [soil metagenome]
MLTAVHYRNEAQVRGFVAHLLELPLPPGWRLAVAVADNSSSWSTDTDLPPDVTVYANANTGYLGGCAFAYEAWRAEAGQTPAWLGVVNTDLEFAPNFFYRLLNTALLDTAGIVAPNVLLDNGARQNPFMRSRPLRSWLQAYMLVWRNRPLSRLWDLGFVTKQKLDAFRNPHLQGEPEKIYAPHGSAVFLRDTLLKQSTLAYRGFMYFEELHLAEQAREAGLDVWWLPDLVVRHHQNATTGGVSARRRWRWKYTSTRVILEDYFG